MKEASTTRKKKTSYRHRRGICMAISGIVYLFIVYIAMFFIPSAINYIAYPLFAIAPFLLYLIFAGYIKGLRIGPISVDLDNTDIINKEYYKDSFENYLTERQKPQPERESLRSLFEYVVVELPSVENEKEGAQFIETMKKRIRFYTINFRYIVFIRKGAFITSIDSDSLKSLSERPEFGISILSVIKNQIYDIPVPFVNMFNCIHVGLESDAIEILKTLQRRNIDYVSITKKDGEFVGISLRNSIVNKLLIWVSEYLIDPNNVEK